MVVCFALRQNIKVMPLDALSSGLTWSAMSKVLPPLTRALKCSVFLSGTSNFVPHELAKSIVSGPESYDAIAYKTICIRDSTRM